MELIHAQRRLYPRNGVAAHVIGYIGEVSEAELNTADFARYNQGDVIGKAGIERQYNEILTGVDGQRQVLVDSRGSERHVIGMKEAVPGKPLRLTIDLDLQTVAELAMEGRRGAVVALDPRNGEVLAMVSQPAFDPSKFAGRISASNWQELTDNPDNPMLNRAIQAQLAPGSTFKPIDGFGGAGDRRGRRAARRALCRRCKLLRALFQVSPEGRTRQRRSSPGDRAVLRRLLLQPRQPPRDRQDRGVC